MTTRLFLVLLLLGARAAGATTYWIDGTKVGGGGCGASQANACKGWHDLILNNQAIKLNNSSPDTVNVVNSGTYAGNGNGKCWQVGTNGRTAGNELTIKCTDAAGTYAPGTCTLTGTGVTVTSGDGLLGIGRNNCGDGDSWNFGQAEYVQWHGINVVAGTLTNRYLVAVPPIHHILFRDMTIDGGTTLTTDAFGADRGDHITEINVTVQNCGTGGAYGCNSFQKTNNVAVIGSNFGPRRDFPNIPPGVGSSNTDCLTTQGASRVLQDGNTCHGMGDGYDHGQFDVTKADKLIARYNDSYDVIGYSTQANNAGNDHNMKLSGDHDSNTVTGANIYYNNVLRFTNLLYWNGGYWPTEQARDTDFWNNTTYCPWHRNNDYTNACLTIDTNERGDNLPVLNSIFDGPDQVTGGAYPPIVIKGGGSTDCSASGCRWVKNGFWFNERGGNALCLLSDNANIASASFECDMDRTGGGTSWATTGSNSGNFRADPMFQSRSTTSQSLAGLRLTTASGTYLDGGACFCTADGPGVSASSIVVTCGAAAGGAAIFNDPKHYFPDPTDYYGVANSDCVGKGVRAIDDGALTAGCFDFMIAGASAGQRTVTSEVTATRTINFTPAATWSAGACVHVPWVGSGPPIGAADKATSGTTTATTAPPTTSTTAAATTTTTASTPTSLVPQHHR